MKKIAILNCRNAICVCAGASCLHALNSRTGKFGRYEGEEVELCAFWYCNGCDMPDDDAGLREKIDRVKSLGIESMHLGGVYSPERQGRWRRVSGDYQNRR